MHIRITLEGDDFIAGLEIDFEFTEGEIVFGDIRVLRVIDWDLEGEFYNDRKGDEIIGDGDVAYVIQAARELLNFADGQFYDRARDRALDVAMFEATSPY